MEKEENYTSSILENLLSEITEEEQKKTDKKMLLAAKIDEAIKVKGWKKKDFAEAMNKRPSEISKWLSGTHNFTSDTIFDIENILNIKLFDFSDKKEKQGLKFEINISSKAKPFINNYYSDILNNTNNYKIKTVKQFFEYTA